MSFTEIMEDEFSLKNLEETKQKKVDFHWRNIMPIPHFLTKAYLSLEKPDPQSVAQAFFVALKEFDLNAKVHTVETSKDPDLVLEEISDDAGENKDPNSEDNPNTVEKDDNESSNENKCSSTFVYILQFCNLCSLGKIQPVLYSVTLTPEIKQWFNSLLYCRIVRLSCYE
jgi:hypothetical protein